jgi:hypothetical protein
MEAIMVKNCRYLCLCCTSCHGNSVYTCTCASLRCYQNIIFCMPPLFTFCICSWEGTSLPQSSMYLLKCFGIWNYVKRTLLLVLHPSSPTISIAEAIHEMPVDIFFIYKRARHFDYNSTATQHSRTSLDSVEAGIQSCYSSSSSLH